MRYEVILHRIAKRDIKKFDPHVRNRIIAVLEKISEDPRLPGSIRLIGYVDIYQYRVGDYRIIYQIKDSEFQVLVLDVKPRGGVYNKY